MCRKDLFALVKKVQTKENDYKNAILKLIKQFQPLIKKYSYLLSYRDAQSELILAFIEIIHKIPISNPNFKQNKYIISYINKSIRNNYIYLSKNMENYIAYEYPINLDITKFPYRINIENKLFIQDLLPLLTKRQKEIINLKYYQEYSDIEISNQLGISRQAVNKTKNRAIKRMRKHCKHNRVLEDTN